MRSTSGPPSTRLVSLLAGDLTGFRRETASGGRARFVGANGSVLEVSSRIERRFLGRTEVAVFEASLPGSLPGGAIVELRHTGNMRRSGVTASALAGGEPVKEIADRLGSDEELARALLPLDFTRFQIRGDHGEASARCELMGASLVGIALPPIRSYVHLYPDQLEAMMAGLTRLRQLLDST